MESVVRMFLEGTKMQTLLKCRGFITKEKERRAQGNHRKVPLLEGL